MPPVSITRALDPRRTMLLICDVQSKFRAPIYSFSEMCLAIRKMTRAAAILEMPVMATEQNPTALGGTVPDVGLDELPPHLLLGVHSKTKFSMCIPPIQEKIKEKGIDTDTAIVVGIESHICVLQSTLDLLASDIRVFVLADAVSSVNRQEIGVALEVMRQAGAVVSTTESVMFRLMRVDPSEDTPSTPNVLLSSTRTQVALLRGWQRVRKMGRACGTMLMRADVRRIMRGTMASNIIFFRKFSAVLLPRASTAQRNRLICAIREWATSDEPGVAVATDWSARDDALLLKQCIELNDPTNSGVSIALRRYGVHTSIPAASERLRSLLEETDTPALSLLRRSCPRWWQGMLLGSDNSIALSIIGGAADAKAESEGRAGQLAYNGVISELASEDADTSEWMPVEQMSADGLVQYIGTDPFASIAPLSVERLMRIDQTRLAVYDRHVNTDFVDAVFAAL